MVNYTKFKDGYKRETTFGESIIVLAGDDTFLWGGLSQDSEHPSPVTSISKTAVGVNTKEVDTAGDMWKNEEILTGLYGIVFQNGIPFEAALGKSATTGPVSGVYTHTITPSDDGSLLPSFTLQHELSGTGTDWATQFMGCKIRSMILLMDYAGGYLVGMLDWLGADSQDPGFMLTNNPALPPTATNPSYTWAGFTKTFAGGSAALAGLKYMELLIDSGLTPRFAPRWDGATWKGRQAYEHAEAPTIEYKLIMRLHPQSDDLWDEMRATGNTEDIVFKWAKSTDDYIEITLHDCAIITHPQKTMIKNELMVEVECIPRAMSVIVKDTIAGGYYGE